MWETCLIDNVAGKTWKKKSEDEWVVNSRVANPELNSFHRREPENRNANTSKQGESECEQISYANHSEETLTRPTNNSLEMSGSRLVS